MDITRQISSLFWDASLVFGMVTIGLAVVWSVTTRANREIILGVLPGVVGLNLTFACIFLWTFFALPIRVVHLVRMGQYLGGIVFNISFILFLANLNGKQKQRTLPLIAATIGAGLCVFRIVVEFFLDPASNSFYGLSYGVVFILNVGFMFLTITMILVLFRLKPDKSDSIDKREIKKVCNKIVWAIIFFLPVFGLDSLWPSGAHPLGYRLTSLAAFGLIFNYFYVRFFYGWISFHVGKESSSLPPALDDRHLEEFSITEREAAVIAMLVSGMIGKEIAWKLGISRSTVKNHIFNIYQKTGISNRVELLNLFALSSYRVEATSASASKDPLE